ncbi:MAG: hypothetical protein WEC73_01425 [Chthoniobacterales bacterium]
MKASIFFLAILFVVAAVSGVRAQAFHADFGTCGFSRPGLSVTWAGYPSIRLNTGWGGGYRYAAPRALYCAPVVRYVCYPAPVVNYYYGSGPVFGGLSTTSTSTRRGRFAARPAGGASIVPNPVVFGTSEQAAPHDVQRPLR